VGRQLKRSKILLGLLVMLALVASMVMTAPLLAQPLTFTGDVEVDFTGSGVLIFNDMVGDVGMPGDNTTIPGPTGWDIKDLRLYLSADIMYIGINVGSNSSTILGDADGDGNPSVTSAYLSGYGGTDTPSLGGTESAAVYFDLNQDGTWDVIAGISGVTDYYGFSVNVFTYSPTPPYFSPPANFGTALPTHKGTISPNPSSSDPDLEFTITNWSTLPNQDGSPGFTVGARLGSGDDDGIGEDYLLYYYQSSGICIEKTVDCNNDGVFLDEDWGEPGDNATWKVVVTNCCNVTLYDVSVWDDLMGTLDNIAVFNASDSETYEYQTQVDVDTTNWAYVYGYDEPGAPVSAEDWATNRIWREVGGTALPVDKLLLLAPWAVLLGCTGVVALLMLRKRRRA
jgi:hypothetical protein